RDENGDIVVEAAPEYSAPPHAPFARDERSPSNYDRRRNSGNRGGRNTRGGRQERSARPDRNGREARAPHFQRDEPDDEPFAPLYGNRSTPAPRRFEDEANAATGVLQERETNETDSAKLNAAEPAPFDEGALTEAPVDVSQVRTVYPFGISRSRLTRV